MGNLKLDFYANDKVKINADYGMCRAGMHLSPDGNITSKEVKSGLGCAAIKLTNS